MVHGLGLIFMKSRLLAGNLAVVVGVSGGLSVFFHCKKYS